MKNWEAIEWCLFILTITIPTLFILMFTLRVIDKPMPPESAKFMADLMNVMAGGILGILGTLLATLKKKKKSKK